MREEEQRGKDKSAGKKGRESMKMKREREKEIMIPKQWTAFVFIWCDCLHALLLVAVGEREGRARDE